MSLFNTQRKKTTNPTAGETKLTTAPKKVVATKKAVSTNKPAKATKTPASTAKVVKAETVVAKHSFIIKPRVTEKAGILAEKGIYTFEVEMRSNSQQIAAEIRKTYKVTPIKVSIAPIPRKSMFVRGKSGSTVAGKKAYVYLKKGDKIEFN